MGLLIANLCSREEVISMWLSDLTSVSLYNCGNAEAILQYNTTPIWLVVLLLLQHLRKEPCIPKLSKFTASEFDNCT